MPPVKHAILSASSSDRWLHCTPSARLEQNFSDRESEAAAEGSAAHALAEHKLRRVLKLQSKKPISKYDCDEMDEHTDGYVQFVQELIVDAKQYCSDPMVVVEQRLDLGSWVPEAFGTADCVIIADRVLYIIDLKYGQGHLVEVEHNSQLMLYALGALSLFGDLYDFDTVSLSIYQPRRENVGTWNISVTDLLSWAEQELKPKAAQAFAGDGTACPGSWCTFCKAAVKCRARAEENLRLAQYEFGKPALLTDEEVEDVLGQLDALTSWAESVMAYAQEAALNHGKQWNGWKIVEGRSIRKYSDEQAIIEAANAAGYHDIFRKTLLPLGEMEKLMGKKDFQSVLGSLIIKPQGKLTLVPASDKRPAVNTAATDFKNIQEE